MKKYKLMFVENTVGDSIGDLRGAFELLILKNAKYVSTNERFTIGNIIDCFDEEELMKLKIRIDNELEYSKCLR